MADWPQHHRPPPRLTVSARAPQPRLKWLDPRVSVRRRIRKLPPRRDRGCEGNQAVKRVTKARNRTEQGGGDCAPHLLEPLIDLFLEVEAGLLQRDHVGVGRRYVAAELPSFDALGRDSPPCMPRVESLGECRSTQPELTPGFSDGEHDHLCMLITVFSEVHLYNPHVSPDLPEAAAVAATA